MPLITYIFQHNVNNHIVLHYNVIQFKCLQHKCLEISAIVDLGPSNLYLVSCHMTELS